MNRQKRALLIGIILGDGYLSKHGGLSIEDSLKQEEFVKWKKDLLAKIFNDGTGRTNLFYRDRFDKRTQKTYSSVSCHKQHKYLKLLRRWIYTPEKTYTRQVLNYLSPEAIAIWFMDDGNLRGYISRKTGAIKSIQVSLYTHCPLEQAEVVRDYFEQQWGITFSIYAHKSVFYLCANTANGNKFLDLIRPHVIPSMSYKVDLISTSARPQQFTTKTIG